MRLILSGLTISAVLSVAAYGQTAQFEVVSIKAPCGILPFFGIHGWRAGYIRPRHVPLQLHRSTASSAPSAPENHGGGHNGGGRDFGHAGLMNFNGQARYRGDYQTMEELAVLFDHIEKSPTAN